MARPRTFNEERAVEAAMRAFWATGYEATSTHDLCDATALGRSSIYNTFKSKHDLFTRALHQYTDIMTGRQIVLLESDAPVREKIRTMLHQVIEDECGDRLGCLVINTSVELVSRDPAIAEQLRRDYDRRIDALRAAIDLARRNGEIAKSKDSLVLAHFITATISGLRIIARTGANRSVLEATAATALDAL